MALYARAIKNEAWTAMSQLPPIVRPRASFSNDGFAKPASFEGSTF